MKSWKQIALCLLILLVALGGWYGFKYSASGAGDATISAATAPRQGGRTSTGGGGGGGGRAAPLVMVEPVAQELINNRLMAIGTARALSTVAVTPYSSGTMTELHVSAGAVVKAGDIIALLDAEMEEIAYAKAQTALKDAENTLQRVVRLRQTNTATQVQEVAADLAVANTKLVVQDAQLALSRRTIRAPISGTVGILAVDAGNYITSQTVIARIDDTSKILMDLWVPERFVPQIRLGLPLSAESTALAGVVREGHVTAIDNMLDEASRTLRVRGEFANPDGALRAGMSFSITIAFPGESFPSVDPLSIQWGSDGSYVWRVVDGIAEQVPARIIQRNTVSVLVDAALQDGDMIVTEGVQSVRAGAAVTVKDQDQTKDQGKSDTVSQKN